MSLLDRLFFRQERDMAQQLQAKAGLKDGLDEYVTSFPHHQNAINCLRAGTRPFRRNTA